MNPSLAYLHAHLAGLEARVHLAVARRRADDPMPEDRFRGLYIPDAEVDRLLAHSRLPLIEPNSRASHADHVAMAEAEAEAAEAAGGDVRLRRLARAFHLDERDIELLVVALAHDVYAMYERLYGYLNDDVSQRRASIGLALELSGATHADGDQRRRLSSAGDLTRRRLILVEDIDRPFLTRPLRVPDRVAAFLLGDDEPESDVHDLLLSLTDVDRSAAPQIVRHIELGEPLIFVRESAGAAGRACAVSSVRAALGRVLSVDVSRLASSSDVADLAVRLAREASMQGAGLVVGPVELLVERGIEAVRAVAECEAPVVVVIGQRNWDPQWSSRIPLSVEAPMLSHVDRDRLWGEAFASSDGVQPASMMQFRLAPEQIARAARAARQHAAADARDVGIDDLRAGARGQNASGLERLARRVEPKVGWDDLVLPETVVGQLRELVARVRQRDHVLDEWGLGRSTSKGRGIKALFAGDSGTGKTVSAEMIARELGLDLYVIDLSTVVDKYVGETEKNLDRIFAEADRVNGVLLFDEADALFGKRSEVKDAQDRYANVEVAYLLQRMEMFEGLAILTTNLRSNLDEAFARRLDAIVDFPMPEEGDRRLLWELNLRGDAPVDDTLDLDFLARAFRLSGGNVRNIVLSAAYLAADKERSLGMADLIKATEREYRKLGHLCVESEFGPYYDLVHQPA